MNVGDEITVELESINEAIAVVVLPLLPGGTYTMEYTHNGPADSQLLLTIIIIVVAVSCCCLCTLGAIAVIYFCYLACKDEKPKYFPNRR